MACPCCVKCPTGCSLRYKQTTSWEGITLPDSCGRLTCNAWADNDGTYVRVLRTQSGDGLTIPGGGLVIIGTSCYLTGYVGTSKIGNDYPEAEGACRSVQIIWRWKLPFSDCSATTGGPYSLTAEFYSGYKNLWIGTGEQAFAISSAGDACFGMSSPTVTLEFPP